MHVKHQRTHQRFLFQRYYCVGFVIPFRILIWNWAEWKRKKGSNQKKKQNKNQQCKSPLFWRVCDFQSKRVTSTKTNYILFIWLMWLRRGRRVITLNLKRVKRNVFPILKPKTSFMMNFALYFLDGNSIRSPFSTDFHRCSPICTAISLSGTKLKQEFPSLL